MAILNTDTMPQDPIEQIIWLDGVKEAVERELDSLYENAYFTARLTSRFSVALQVGRASKKRALAWTRRANERRGRSVRWNDGADPTSTAYRGED
jgi:hypothetical protein